MATYYTDFTEYSAGTTPSDWTHEWDSGGSFSVKDDGNLYLDLLSGGGGDYSDSVSWDDVPNPADVEIYAVIDPSDADRRIAVRGQDNVGNRNVYFVRLNSGSLQISAYKNDSFTELAATEIGSISGKTAFRFRVNSSNLKAKAWDAGTTEPSSWQVETTDSAHTTSDWNGPLQFSTNSDASHKIYQYGVGTNGDTAPKIGVQAPSTPQNLTSTVSGDDITLDWDAVNWNGDQGHYNVYRKYDGSAYSDIADVPSGTTSYTDSALLDGEQYTYYVDAVNSAGSSGNSNTTSSTTSLPAPSNASTSVSSDDITVSWSDNSDNENGFRIYRKHDGGNLSQIADVGSNTTSYNDTALLDGEQYTYEIEAYTEHVTTSRTTTSGTTLLPSPTNLNLSL